MNRRLFMTQLAAMGISTLLPIATLSHATNRQQPGLRNLILIELSGGNDGLNNVIPYRDTHYYQLRPTLSVSKDTVLHLTDSLAFNPALGSLYPLWQTGDLALISGVGYPDPNRSHFRSIEIWETASDADETLVEGWLTPIASQLPEHNAAGVKAISLSKDQGPLAGAVANTLVFNNLDRFLRQANRLTRTASSTDNPALQHVLRVRNTTHKAALEFAKKFASLPQLSDTFPRSRIASQLGTIAQIIATGSGPQIYKISHTGFDTHANQLNTHNRLLRELATALSALHGELKTRNLWNDTVVMTYSEFGRRAKENASKGTDHGTASVQYIMGGRVNGGLYGEQPALGNLINDDLEYKIDFRSLYKTVASDWLQQRDLPSRLDRFATLPIFS